MKKAYERNRCSSGKPNAFSDYPLLKTVEQMSKVSGLGENKLRKLMDDGELEYVQNGNRRLIMDSAIFDWYDSAKHPAMCNNK